ncbi:MAG: DUF805 domain-containing protein [Bacilli bacterium]|nr:DUF805 domain-containing protein [Bacilli bacterium]
MYCKKCKNVINDNEYYCPYCGYSNKHNDIEPKKEKITIKKCFVNFFINFFNASGVATRLEFWVINTIYVITTLILYIFKLNMINFIFNAIFFIPLICLSIRRYHDINKSGIFAILGCYFKTSYVISLFTTNEKAKIIILITAIIALLLELILLSFPSDENSKWNPDNGYLD